jgi:hypothetical protein
MSDSKIEKVREIPKGLTNAGKGRPKGALNKSTQSAKDAIAIAAERLGGAGRLVEWAKEDAANERAFWSTIYPKLLPLQVNAEVTYNAIDELLKQVDGSQLSPNDSPS